MLEIGVRDGQSMQLWQEYFPHAGAKIWGMAYPAPPGIALGDRQQVNGMGRVELFFGSRPTQHSLTISS